MLASVTTRNASVLATDSPMFNVLVRKLVDSKMRSLHGPIQTANGYSISRRIAGLFLRLGCVGGFCKGKEESNKNVKDKRDATKACSSHS